MSKQKKEETGAKDAGRAIYRKGKGSIGVSFILAVINSIPRKPTYDEWMESATPWDKISDGIYKIGVVVLGLALLYYGLKFIVFVLKLLEAFGRY